jgi:hypothetical protein
VRQVVVTTPLTATFVLPTTPGASFSVSFVGTPGVSYQLETTEDLFANPVSWIAVGNPVIGTGGSSTIPVPAASVNPSGVRVYRIRQL